MRISPLVISLVTTLSSRGLRSSSLSATGGSLSNAVSAFARPDTITTTTHNNILRRTLTANMASNSDNANDATATSSDAVDPVYPGTAVERMMNVRARVAELAKGDDLNQKWEDVRRKILWAGGLKDMPNAIPGQGYTGHSFNDYNHVDLTCMLPVDNTNQGEVKGIALGNQLGEGVRIASLPELGPGGSWSTCITGCNQVPPGDVAHVQFKSRIAFKLVWCPTKQFDTFVLIDDEGNLLAKGRPCDGPEGLPPLRERQTNYRIVYGSKYASAAEAVAAEEQ